jgi:hypothetical protein
MRRTHSEIELSEKHLCSPRAAMRRVRSEIDFSAPVPAGPRTPTAGALAATVGIGYFPLHNSRAGPVRQWAIAQAVVPREGMGPRHGARDKDVARPDSDARRGDGRTDARRGSEGESALRTGSRMLRARSFQSLSSGIDLPRDRFVRRSEIEPFSDFAGPGYGARDEDSASLASGARWRREDGGSDSDHEFALRTCRTPQPPAGSAMRRPRSFQSLSDVRSAQDQFVRRPEIIEQGSDSGPPTPAPGPITRRVALDPAQRASGMPVRVQDESDENPGNRTGSKMRRARSFQTLSSNVRSELQRSAQDQFVQRRPEIIEQGSGSGPPTPAPGQTTRRVPLSPAQRSPGTTVRVHDQKPGKPRAARHQYETRQHNMNRLLADWCAQERERVLREGGERDASANVVHASTSVAAVGVTESRFSVVLMLLSTLWMSLASLGSWVHLVQSVTGLTRTIAQLVPGTRAGNARSPQAELERRKEELREAERVLAKARRAVQEAEVRVATLSAFSMQTGE